MGKLHKEDDGRSQSKGDLRWKVVSIVTVMGFIAMLQLLVVENRWDSSQRHTPPYAFRSLTKKLRISSGSSQFTVLHRSKCNLVIFACAQYRPEFEQKVMFD